MVQKMYKQVYMPIAVLLLLSGVLVLNIKVTLHAGINHEAMKILLAFLCRL